ncbi:hypothetical protein GKE82_23695 [Conexibacter sp. W3-3-2]|uniref:hypothetical protein n=1 Tax=Conexibacter sp. W3-3-2 TaxID=2675227 RepID=UPI0012B98A26|nr:hypothetical protein [Conexibacter sp. W3-3-2]MTD47210.1 hypothetical protein [Conexibacter sp. W3-3-2]
MTLPDLVRQLLAATAHTLRARGNRSRDEISDEYLIDGRPRTPHDQALETLQGLLHAPPLHYLPAPVNSNDPGPDGPTVSDRYLRTGVVVTDHDRTVQQLARRLHDQP